MSEDRDDPWLSPGDTQILDMWEAAAASFHEQTMQTAITMKRGRGPLIGVFGSARTPKQAPKVFRRYGTLLQQLGEAMGKAGLGAVTGGCPGVPMAIEVGLRATRTHVAVQPIFGIRIVFPGTDFEEKEPDSETVDRMVKTLTFGTRIELMEAATEGCILGPGGIGTDTEGALFRQIEQLRNLTGRGGPIVFFGKEFWTPQLHRLSNLANWGVAGRNELRATITDSPKKAVAALLAHNGNRERAKLALAAGEAMENADATRELMRQAAEGSSELDSHRIAHETAKARVLETRTALEAHEAAA